VSLKISFQLGTVAHIHNPTYLDGGDSEDHSLRPGSSILTKKAEGGGMHLSSHLLRKHKYEDCNPGQHLPPPAKM
jgi:hypothetical protein